MTVFGLIHSPLVGPSTWGPVAEALRGRGRAALVPSLHAAAESEPHYRRHAWAAAQALAERPPDAPLILVGHSGAGPLLPVIRQALRQPVAAYLFADAGLPQPGRSRLDLLEWESPEHAAQFRAWLAQGRRFPAWSDADLRPLVPDEARRRALLADLHPWGPAFFEEPFPVDDTWPEAPCAYLQFSAVYEPHARRARELGWPVRLLAAGHFHLLVDPDGVAQALLDLSAELRAL